MAPFLTYTCKEKSIYIYIYIALLHGWACVWGLSMGHDSIGMEMGHDGPRQFSNNHRMGLSLPRWRLVFLCNFGSALIVKVVKAKIQHVGNGRGWAGSQQSPNLIKATGVMSPISA